MLFDVFISHASEDKDAFVRPLAERLRAERVEVWYDEFSLRVGDSLRRSIDRGLAQSRFGIVVLSHRFIEKQWSQWELDGLVSRQVAGASDVILPVWLGVDRDDVIAFSPPLADKVAVDGSLSLDAVVERLLDRIRPQGSTLVVARDFLLDRGFEPPVITDDWWLDVAVAAESNPMEGTFQEAMGWGRWGFPLPDATAESSERGVRLGWAALQTQWILEANQRPITQVTPPDEVDEFIGSQIGLAEMCGENLHYLTAYAPQLMVPGLGGRFEAELDAWYRRSLAWKQTHDTTISESVALRHDDLDEYDAASLACNFVQGEGVVGGPPVKYFSTIDYLAWFLSSNSEWLGEPVRSVLTRGMSEWGVWIWDGLDRAAELDFGYEIHREFAGKFGTALQSAKSVDALKISKKARRDLLHRLEFSVRLLRLNEDAEELSVRVLDPAFLRHYFDGELRRKRRRK